MHTLINTSAQISGNPQLHCKECAWDTVHNPVPRFLLAKTSNMEVFHALTWKFEKSLCDFCKNGRVFRLVLLIKGMTIITLIWNQIAYLFVSISDRACANEKDLSLTYSGLLTGKVIVLLP